MQTIKLIIPGEYYDSQIDCANMYLWTIDESIVILDFNRLILSETSFELSPSELQQFVVQEQDNPLPFPYADLSILNNTLYMGDRDGFFEATIDHERKISSPKKLWDGPALNLAAKNGYLALSGLNEGLFLYHIEQKRVVRLLEEHSNSAGWLYTALFNSSYFNEGTLVELESDNKTNGTGMTTKRHLVPGADIFSSSANNISQTYAWGAGDKICRSDGREIEVVRYHPNKASPERLVNLGTVQTGHDWQGDIVSAGSAPFGYIIEGDDGLLVVNSKNESSWLPGEPVDWRVFPDSPYRNQLHVIYEDHLCIYSFYQDYFVDQESKKVGTRPMSIVEA